MEQPITVIKKYGNRRLYDTENSRYITLDDLSQLIQAGKDVKVVDAKTGADLTKSVLLQIISEQEKDRDMLPVSFLKNVIKYSDAAIREPLHRYLSFSLDSFLQAQRQFEQQYRQVAGGMLNPMAWMMNSMGGGQPGAAGFEPPPPAPGAPFSEPPPDMPPPDISPPDMAPPARAEEKEEATRETAADDSTADQLDLLKEQMAQMQQMMAQLVDKKK